MKQLLPYDREKAVAYAKKWAHDRNPAFLNFDSLGGDCTNFASQCLFAGSGVMDYAHLFGWYYIDGNKKSPSWTGVPYLYNFLLGKHQHGPVAQETNLEGVQPGDLIQLATMQDAFHHTPVVVAVTGLPSPETIFVAAHSFDCFRRPLSSYPIRKARFLHITHVLP